MNSRTTNLARKGGSGSLYGDDIQNLVMEAQEYNNIYHIKV